MSSNDHLVKCLSVSDLQLPVGEGRAFKGVVDVVRTEKLLWNPNSDDGKDFERKPLLEMSDPKLLKETTEARNALIEQVNTLSLKLLKYLETLKNVYCDISSKFTYRIYKV